MSKNKKLKKIKFFKEGDIFFSEFKGSIGFEQKGKGKNNLRPVLIIKKYNRNLFLGLPCTTSKKENKYYLSIGKIRGKENFVILSQLKVFDESRLEYRIGRIKFSERKKVIKKLQQELEDSINS